VLRINVFVRFQVLTLVSMKIRVFWDIASCTLVGVDQCLEVHAASIIMVIITLLIEAECTSETSVCSETTWCYIPEGSNLDMSLCNFPPVEVVYFHLPQG
jgi:hypothetical protein